LSKLSLSAPTKLNQKKMEPIHVGIDAFRLVGPRTSIGTYTQELIAALLLLGFRITLFAPRVEENADLNEYVQTGSPCDVVYAPKPSEPERLPGDLFRWNQRTLPTLLRSHPCDVFIAPYQQVPCFTPYGIPTLVVIHDLCGLRPDCGYRVFGKAWARHYWNLLTAAFRASRIIPISVATREDMLRKFPFCKKRLAQPIYNQVSGQTLSAEDAALHLSPLGIPKGGFVLAFGITGPRKSLDIALRGYAIYREKGGTLPLVLLSTQDQTQIENLIPEKFRHDIVFLPRVSVCERDALYRLASCLLFCSRCEGFGYPVVEAMRQGCPVIASATTPAAEITNGIIELMSHPDAAQCAALIHRYANMDQTPREQLVASLTARSEIYAGASFAKDFQREIQFLSA
jgi:glycosyltransferase involved in cell wall biosynthesis